jgi:hypothetical protein
MTCHDGLVQAVVRRQVLGDLPFAEALQAGRVGLWRAIPSIGSGQAWAMTLSGEQSRYTLVPTRRQWLTQGFYLSRSQTPSWCGKR